MFLSRHSFLSLRCQAVLSFSLIMLLMKHSEIHHFHISSYVRMHVCFSILIRFDLTGTVRHILKAMD